MTVNSRLITRLTLAAIGGLVVSLLAPLPMACVSTFVMGWIAFEID